MMGALRMDKLNHVLIIGGGIGGLCLAQEGR
jgi:hypothetical protein